VPIETTFGSGSGAHRLEARATATTARRAGEALAGTLAVGLAVAAVAVAGPGDAGTTGWLRSALVVVWALGASVAARHGPAGDVALGGTLLAAVGTFAASADAHRDLGSEAAFVADLAVRLAVALAPVVLAHLLVVLPDGRLATRSRRVAVGALYATGLVAGLALLADRDDVPRLPVIAGGVVVVGGALLAGHGRYERATAEDRRQLQFLGLALAIVAEVALVVVACHLLARWPGRPGAVIAAASGVVPVALAGATRRRLLAHADRVLTAMVSVTGVTALVVGVYVLVVVGLGRRPEGDERALLVSSMAAAAVIALLYPTTRDRLADAANRLVYGDRAAPDTALRSFGARMTRALPLDELLLQLAESLRRTFLLRSAEVWTGADGHYELAAGVPHRTAPTLVIGAKERTVVARAGVSGGTWTDVWLPALSAGRDSGLLRVAPLVHSGSLLGLLVLERQPGSAALTEDDDTVLAELARQVGLALHNVQLDSALQASLEELQRTNVELQESRARIVAAGDAERRKLERDLHDGAQQHLVAMSVKLRLVRDAIDDDPEDARELLAELASDIQEAVQELRRLAHGIFPPLLTSGGLPDALPHAASRAALPTTVELTDVARYPTEIEAAVYFCCLEALQNAGKHAGPDATATVRVWRDGSELRFEVADTGPGFDPTGGASAGHGFVNMADRLGAVDGRLTVDTAPGAGVRVHGRLPVAPP
jgi:signal transduction histidine kinase